MARRWFRRGLLRGGLLCRGLMRGVGLASLLAAACTSPSSPSELGARSGPAVPGALDVWFSGCAVVRSGALCEAVPGGALTLWIAATQDETHRFAIAETALEPRERSVLEGGIRYRLALPEARGTLRVTSAAGSEFHLELGPRRAFAELDRARELRESGQPDAAWPLVEAALASTDPEERVRARALAARLELGRGHVDAAVLGLTQSFEEHERLGRLSDALQDALALSFVEATQRGDPERAEAWLERLAPALGKVPQARAGHEQYLGLVAQLQGQLLVAGERYERALGHARRLADDAKYRTILAAQAQIDAALGRLPAAIARVRDALAGGEGLPPCTRGPLHANLGWLGVLASEVGDPGVDVGRELETALSLDERCGLPYYRRHDLLNLGLWAIERNDLAQAEARASALAQLHAGQTAELAQWEADLRGRIARARGQWSSALAHFAREAALAEARADRDGVLRAQVARGETLERLGEREQALAAFRLADAAVAGNAAAPQFGLQKDGFFGSRDVAIRRLLDALLRSGEVEPAFAVAAQALRRTVGSLAMPARAQALDPARRQAWHGHLARYRQLRAQIERSSADDWRASSAQLELALGERRRIGELARRELEQAWQLLEPEAQSAVAELPEVPEVPGELLLLLVPGQMQWLGFQRWQGQIEVQRLEATPLQSPLAAVQSWVANLGDRLARASQLSILAYGRARSLDFASLELRGAPLAAHLPIVYRLGLHPRPPRASTEKLALVVGDPGGDLPGARREAARVAEWLRPGRALLWLGADAERNRVIDALGRALSFHYAGHGEAAKEDDVTGLPLAGGARLTTGDVLALSSVPEHVVLAACDVGRSQGEPWAGGWSLAHAFVMAGAREVIAPVRPIPDRDAVTLTYFYEELRAPEQPSWSRALGRAQARAAKAGARDWAALRVFTP